MPSRKKQFTGFKHRVLGLIRRAFRWNQVHTGAEVARVANTKWMTRVRKFTKRAAFKVRKYAKFTAPHTGQEVARVANTKFLSRVRKIRQKAGFKFRKLAKFTNFHFTQAPQNTSVQLLKLVGRKGKKLKQKRRRASYQLLKTGLQPSVALVHFQARKRRGKAKRGRQAVAFFKTGHTGLSPVVGTTGTWVATYINRRGGDS